MISVCMATYNGQDFINDQLNSILYQLNANDEIIIVDDCSTDNTYDMLLNYSDARLKIFRNDENEGHISTFEKSIKYSSGDFIFLSDQDDIWVDGRVNLMVGELSSKNFVASNYNLIDKFNNAISRTVDQPLLRKNSNKNLLNIISIFLGNSNYFGCAMAFRSSMKSIILPFPVGLESHDLWIATAANFTGSVSHIEGTTLLRRIHGNNFSVINRSPKKKFLARIVFLKTIYSLILRKVFSNA